VQHDGEQAFVLLAGKNVPERRLVVIGTKKIGMVDLQKGLSPAEAVLVYGTTGEPARKGFRDVLEFDHWQSLSLFLPGTRSTAARRLTRWRHCFENVTTSVRRRSTISLSRVPLPRWHE